MSARALVAASLLTAMLAGCDSKPTVIDTRPKDAPEVTAALRQPVELPPSITASQQYRCADNSLALVDWLSDGRSALVRAEAKASQVRVSAPAAGGVMTGGGFSLKGAKGDGTVTFGSPAHPKPQRCHV